MENRKRTGRQIRKARKEKKLTLAELADLVGKSENYIGKIERGECTPSIKCYEKICSFLDVDFERSSTHCWNWRRAQSFFFYNSISACALGLAYTGSSKRSVV